ncbi:hypothetical protein TWF696_002664 [Orbilia brochopaga]|uniref:Uncharacterized protein n=1 Tax=Orbilia brochopaga TaxID=3140254 RepID=A0AAV9U2C9_9PEZI
MPRVREGAVARRRRRARERRRANALARARARAQARPPAPPLPPNPPNAPANPPAVDPVPPIAIPSSSSAAVPPAAASGSAAPGSATSGSANRQDRNAARELQRAVYDGFRDVFYNTVYANSGRRPREPQLRAAFATPTMQGRLQRFCDARGFRMRTVMQAVEALIRGGFLRMGNVQNARMRGAMRDGGAPPGAPGGAPLAAAIDTVDAQTQTQNEIENQNEIQPQNQTENQPQNQNEIQNQTEIEVENRNQPKIENQTGDAAAAFVPVPRPGSLGLPPVPRRPIAPPPAMLQMLALLSDVRMLNQVRNEGNRPDGTAPVIADAPSTVTAGPDDAPPSTHVDAADENAKPVQADIVPRTTAMHVDGPRVDTTTVTVIHVNAPVQVNTTTTARHVDDVSPRTGTSLTARPVNNAQTADIGMTARRIDTALTAMQISTTPAKTPVANPEFPSTPKVSAAKSTPASVPEATTPVTSFASAHGMAFDRLAQPLPRRPKTPTPSDRNDPFSAMDDFIALGDIDSPPKQTQVRNRVVSGPARVPATQARPTGTLPMRPMTPPPAAPRVPQTAPPRSTMANLPQRPPPATGPINVVDFSRSQSVRRAPAPRSVFEPSLVPNFIPRPPTPPHYFSVAEAARARMPPAQPVQLPYPLQHSLITEAQRLLEQSCYEFALKWLPDRTASAEFAHPESAELNKWARLIGMRLRGLPPAAYDSRVYMEQMSRFRHAASQIAHLRHTAVHRNKIEARRVVDMLDLAVDFARFLRDGGRAVVLRDMRVQAGDVAARMEYEMAVRRADMLKELERLEVQLRMTRTGGQTDMEVQVRIDAIVAAAAMGREMPVTYAEQDVGRGAN